MPKDKERKYGMTSRIKHKRRSRKSQGTPAFKSLDKASHDYIGFTPLFKPHPKKYDGRGIRLRGETE